jgi:hypothetical protein
MGAVGACADVLSSHSQVKARQGKSCQGKSSHVAHADVLMNETFDEGAPICAHAQGRDQRACQCSGADRASVRLCMPRAAERLVDWWRSQEV